jgi:hypothetical protein
LLKIQHLLHATAAGWHIGEHTAPKKRCAQQLFLYPFFSRTPFTRIIFLNMTFSKVFLNMAFSKTRFTHMLWFKLKPWFEQNQCFCVQTLFLRKELFCTKSVLSTNTMFYTKTMFLLGHCKGCLQLTG